MLVVIRSTKTGNYLHVDGAGQPRWYKDKLHATWFPSYNAARDAGGKLTPWIHDGWEVLCERNAPTREVKS